ncbi:MAG: DNA primase [Deltaproteobacteria bacterium]|nr:DNA primase [Deltaproteobacteria bacterium]
MIARDTIDRIRSRVDIVSIVGESVKLKARGRSHVGLCPFHQEKTGSFTVSADKQLFYCFGCKTSGDVFKFVELNEGLSFMEVVKRLAERAGVELVDDRSDHDRAAEQRARKAKDDLYAANAIAAGFFEKMLREHPFAKLAHDELERRGLPYDGDAHECLASFGIGYAPHGGEGLARYLRTQGVSPAVAQQVGLLAARDDGTYYDAFRHRLVVAIKDIQGRVIAFSGRVLPTPQGAREPKDPPPKYVNSRESAIYSKGQTLFGLFQGRNAIRAMGEVIIVEGNFDLVALHARGIENAVAPLGTAFTEDQARLLRRFAPAVVLLFDADAAGRKATWAARETCKASGLTARSVRLAEGKDPDEFLRVRGVEQMRRALSAARSLDEVLVDDACEPVGAGANLAAKQAALLKIRPILEDQDLAFRDVLAKRAAVGLGLEPTALWRLVRGEAPASAERASGGAAPGSASSPSNPPLNWEEDGLSRGIVGALLSCPEVLEDTEVQDSLALVTGDWAFAVVALREEMRNSRRENRPLDGPALLARMPASIQEFAAAKLVESMSDPTASPDASADGRPDPLNVRRVVRETGHKLERVQAAARFKEIDREVRQAEAAGDLDRAGALLAEKVRLTQLLREAEREARADQGH